LSEKNRVNPKLEDDFSIPNDKINSTRIFSILSRAAIFLEAEKADRALQQLRKISHPTILNSLKGEYFERLGQARQLRGEFGIADGLYKQALIHYRRNQDPYGHFQMLFRRGEISRQLENFTQAIRYYSGARKLASQIQKKSSFFSLSHRAELDCGLGLAERGLGHWNRSVPLLKRALTWFIKSRDQLGEAYSRWALGTTYRFMGNIKLAEIQLKRSLKLYKRSRDLGGQAYSSCGLGGTLRMKGCEIFLNC